MVKKKLKGFNLSNPDKQRQQPRAQKNLIVRFSLTTTTRQR